MSINVLNFKYIQIEMLNMKLFCNGYVAEPGELLYANVALKCILVTLLTFVINCIKFHLRDHCKFSVYSVLSGSKVNKLQLRIICPSLTKWADIFPS